MSKSIRSIVFCGFAASLLCGVASAEPKTPAPAPAEPKSPTIWAPPAEISGKPAPTAAGAAPAATPTAAPVDEKAAKAAKEQACADEAKAKGLKKNKKWAYVDACMKK